MRHVFRIAVLLALAVGATGCWGQTGSEPPIVPIRNMHEQSRYDPQERSGFFADHRTMRPLVEGTVATEMVVDIAVDTGVTGDGSYLMTIPPNIVDEFGGLDGLARHGQGRYDIYCVPCHDGLGTGRGMVQRMGRATLAGGPGAMSPPSFHDDRIRTMPDGQLYATIRNGLGNMPAYAHNIPVNDRWAIVAYVRALQVSQFDARHASLAPSQGDTEVAR